MDNKSASKLEVEVKLESSEILRPSISTPIDRKNISLCIFDQITSPYYTPLLHVYNNHSSQELDIDSLRRSLMETLSIFYPLAGRCKDESTLCCDDQGILFNTSRVSSRICDLFNKSPQQTDFLIKLFPPYPTGPISELTPLAIQINTFACGGMVIGCYEFHKLMDGASLGTFFKYWAGLSTKHDQKELELVKPNFNAAASAFPPFSGPLVRGPTFTNESSTLVVAKRFVFRKNAIRELILKATSEQLPNPTRFEAVSGFVWEHAYAAACTQGDPTLVSFTVNIRTRTTPPLPKQSISNLIININTTFPHTHTHAELAKTIHETVPRVTDTIKGFQGADGAEAIMAYNQSMLQHLSEVKPGYYMFTSWFNLGYNEVDFGLGKPIRVIPYDGLPLPSFARNIVIFIDSPDGIDVWFYLDEKELLLLELNALFLAFAASS